MADDSSQDRNLPASQRKIDKARREGQVARSRDLGHLGALGLGIALMAAGGGLVLDAGGRLLEAGLRFDVRQLVTPAVTSDLAPPVPRVEIIAAWRWCSSITSCDLLSARHRP